MSDVFALTVDGAHFRVSDHRGARRVHLTGEIDVFLSWPVRDALAVAALGSGVTFDLREVTFLDLAIAQIVTRTAVELERSGRPVRFEALSTQVARAFRMAHDVALMDVP